jgi:hypothetical protein
VSTVQGLGTLGYLSSASGSGGGGGDVTSTNLTSTTLGLGTLGYLSSAQLISTIEGLGTLGYLSSASGSGSGSGYKGNNRNPMTNAGAPVKVKQMFFGPNICRLCGLQCESSDALILPM